ncbi:MAG: DUF302 domain-containing protein [Saccharofermentanales bacterium]
MDMFYKVQTDKSFEKVIEDLKKSLGEHKFGVLWELNFKDKLKEKGLDFNKNFHVLEVCNPAQAKKVLEENINVGYFLPCKIVIYDDEGTVFVGMPKPTSLIGMIKDNSLMSIALDVENELKSAISNAI